MQILVQRIYLQYKGFNVIDEISDMKIDGVSAVPLSVCEGEWERRRRRGLARCQGRMIASGCSQKAKPFT